MLSGTARVWLLSAVLVALALTLFLTLLRDLSPPATGVRIPWWALAPIFYVSEALVVKIQFRGEAHSYSFSEIPIVLGLFFATPADLVLAQLVGAGLALGVQRRQSALKLWFNLSQYLVGAVVALALFHLLVGVAGAAEGVGAWLPAFAATAVSILIAITTITAAISLSEGHWSTSGLRPLVLFSLAVGFTNTSLALLAVTLVRAEPAALILGAVPVLLVLIAYRAYVGERRKHAHLEFLYEATGTLQRAPDPGAAAVELLTRAREMFGADLAELVLFPTIEGKKPLRTAVADDAGPVTMEPVDLVPDDPIRRRAYVEEEAFLVRRGWQPRGARSARPEVPELRDAMITPLRGERSILGTLIVGNRSGDLDEFGAQDLQLLETLGNHAAVAFENGQLGQSLNRLHVLNERLEHRTLHDPLTGLGNRTLLLDRLTQALLDEAGEGVMPVVAFIDLDDFKRVNDTLGHAGGDALLIAVADRLRASLRPSDQAIRLGGDEFALLLRDRTDLRHARAIAQRVLDEVQQPFFIQDRTLTIHASLGLAVAEPGSADASALVHRADLAMYRAKLNGKACYVVYDPSMTEPRPVTRDGDESRGG